MSHPNPPAASASLHGATSQHAITAPRSATGPTTTPVVVDEQRRSVALHKQDHAWARATARHLRARGVAEHEVERILSDLVEVFVRRGRHGREVYGAPRTQASMHPSGTTQHVGRTVRRFVAHPLLLAAAAALVMAVVAGPFTTYAVAAGVLALLGVVVATVANLRDSRLPAHMSLLFDPYRR